MTLTIGDWVFVKLRPHRQQSVVRRVNSKLSARYYGLFQVEARVGEVAYKLLLPTIHPVFHISQLKKAIGNHLVESELPPELEVNGPPTEPATILSSRENVTQGRKITEWLILWKDKPIEEATWEKAVEIKIQFPNLCLEDKASLSEGAIDRNQKMEAHERPKVF